MIRDEKFIEVIVETTERWLVPESKIKSIRLDGYNNSGIFNLDVIPLPQLSEESLGFLKIGSTTTKKVGRTLYFLKDSE